MGVRLRLGSSGRRNRVRVDLRILRRTRREDFRIRTVRIRKKSGIFFFPSIRGASAAAETAYAAGFGAALFRELENVSPSVHSEIIERYSRVGEELGISDSGKILSAALEQASGEISEAAARLNSELRANPGNLTGKRVPKEIIPMIRRTVSAYGGEAAVKRAGIAAKTAERYAVSAALKREFEKAVETMNKFLAVRIFSAAKFLDGNTGEALFAETAFGEREKAEHIATSLGIDLKKAETSARRDPSMRKLYALFERETEPEETERPIRDR